MQRRPKCITDCVHVRKLRRPLILKFVDDSGARLGLLGIARSRFRIQNQAMARPIAAHCLRRPSRSTATLEGAQVVLHRASPGLAKTTRPRIGAVIARERLFRELDENRSASCTWISGPPGAGKTALLASFVSDRAMGCLWHQIDTDDADPSAFVGSLARGAQAALGSHHAKRLPPYTPDAAFSLPTFARRFFRELFALAPGLMLVLDDYHEAPLHCPLHDIVRAAIEQTPLNAHITVLSRSHPPPALARGLTSGEVRSLSWEQLKLTAEEVARMAAIHGVVLDARAAAQWLDRCGGWAAGLRLLLRPKTPTDLRVTGEESPTVLFDYFGEEVFRKLPKALQSQLFSLAVLPRVPADAVNELAGAASVEAQLSAMVEQSLFTTVSAEGPPTYRFHPLFRDFLLHRAARELAPDDLLGRRHRGAHALQARGLTDEAAQVLIDAQSWGRLSQLVLDQAPRLMSQGRHTTLGNWVGHIPAEQVQQDPWLLYWLGASQAGHDPVAGRASLERAFELFAFKDDRSGRLLAWSAAVDCIFHIYTDLGQLDLWIATLESMLAADPQFPSPSVEAKVTFSMFVALSFRQPQHPALALWRRRLVVVAATAPDPMFRLLARLHLTVDRIWHGDMPEAGVELDKLKAEAGNSPLSPFVKLVSHLSHSTYALYAGEVERCFEEVENALSTAESSGIHIWDAVLLGQGAALALSHGDLPRGRAFALKRSSIINAAHAEQQSLHHTIEAWSCWLGGERATALAHVRLGLDFSHRMGLPHFNATYLVANAVVSFECGAQDAALKQVREGRSLGELTRNPMIVWMADLLEAYMRLRRGEDAIALIENCMTLGRKHGYRHFFFWPRHAAAVVCLEALVRGIHVDDAIELIVKGQLPAPLEAIDMERWPWSLKIFTLGRFSILVNGQPLRFKGKAQHGPINLLKVLIALGSRDVAERKLIDALWPDADGGAGEQSLATTLSRLRKLIGLHTIKRQDGRLNLEPTLCWVDCWALERALGANVMTLTPQALGATIGRLYHGHFLQADADAPWALHLRERLHVNVLARLNQSARGALSQGHVALATRLYELGLQVDDLVEDFYVGLIRCHMHSGQASYAVTIYRRCQRMLAKRLGVMPSEKTTRLYLAAIEGKTTAR